MSFRNSVLAVLSLMLFTACADEGNLIEPLSVPPALMIDAAATCTGATMPISECQALVTFYNTTNGPDWTSQGGWGVAANPCDWSGVTCSGESSGSVTRVRVRRLGFATCSSEPSPFRSASAVR